MKRCLLSAEVLALCGYGLHSRQILFALSQKFDVACQARRWGENAFISEETAEKQFIINTVRKLHLWQENKTSIDFSVQVTVPNEFERMLPINVGITAGIEVDRVKPEWLLKCNEMNLVIVPSTFAADGFTKTLYQAQDGSVLKLNTPIEVVPESVDTTIFNNEKTEDLNIPLSTTFNFLSVGQWGIGEADRKNFTALIRVFKETFKEHKDKEKIGLIMRTNSITSSLVDEDYTIKKLKSILKDYPEFPKVHLLHGHLSENELARLYKDSRVKAFVALTHGEGWGLPILESGCCGLPILATNWSGHLDFLNLGRWIKLPYELKEIPFQNELFQPGSKWANVDLNEVKRHMLKIYDNWSVPKGWAEELGQKLRENYCIKKIEDRYFEVFDKYNFLSDSDIEKKSEVADSIFGNTNLEEVVK